MIVTTAGQLTEKHVGCKILGLIDIAGWERHLLLRSVEHKDDDSVVLMFRWNDDPSPSNTKRGEFAAGVIVTPRTPVEIHPAPTYEADQ